MNKYLEKKIARQMKSLSKRYYKLKDYLVENEGYICVGSCNNDLSEYLLPPGTTEDQLSYYSKPEGSIRFSDHWNWYSNIKKCKIWDYIQCYNEDLPDPFPRKDSKATSPYYGAAIAIFKDGTYRTLAGAYGHNGFYMPSGNQLIDTFKSYSC